MPPDFAASSREGLQQPLVEKKGHVGQAWPWARRYSGEEQVKVHHGLLWPRQPWQHCGLSPSAGSGLMALLERAAGRSGRLLVPDCVHPQARSRALRLRPDGS